MSNMPYVSYSLANIIINAFKKSNEVFTISYLHFSGLPKFPSIGSRNGHLRGMKELRGRGASSPPLPIPPRPRSLFAGGRHE